MSDTVLQYTLVGRDRLSRAFDSAGKAADRSHGKLAKFAKVGAKAAGGLVAAVGLIGFTSVKAFGEAEAAQQRLEFAFQRFPAMANVSIEALRDLNKTLALKTRFDDDSIASGQAVLAQFKLTGRQVRDVTPLLLDYAAKTGMDVPQAAVALGRSLMGNTRALKTIGINYKSTGNTTKDFANITALMRAKVGGFAEKEGKTTSGRLAILQNQFGEFQELIGQYVIPVLSALIVASMAVVRTLSGQNSVLARVRGAYSSTVDTIDRFRIPILIVAGLIAAVLIPHFIALGIAAVASGVMTSRVWMMYKVDAAKAAVAHSVAVVKMVAGWAVLAARSLFHAARVAAAWFIALGPIGWAIAGIALVVVLVIKHWGTIRRVTLQVWGAVSGAVVAAVRAIGEFLGRIGGFFASTFRDMVAAGKALLIGLKDGIESAITGVVSWILRAPVAKVVGVFIYAGVWLVTRGRQFLTGFLSGVLAIARTIGTWLGRNVISPTTRSFSKAGQWLVSAGRAVIGGLVNGFVAYLRFIGGAGSWVLRNVVQPVIRVFGRAGEWLVGAGRSVVAGLVNGFVAYLRFLGGIGVWFYTHAIRPVINTAVAYAGSLWASGRNLLSGLTRGMLDGMRGIGGWIKTNVVDPIIKHVKSFFGISSPSTVFAGIGGNLVAGLVKGLSGVDMNKLVGKIFGSMPRALGAIVDKGIIALEHLSEKARNALGTLFDGGSPGTSFRPITFRGKRMNATTAQKILAAEKLLGGGVKFHITQGSYSTRVKASGTTHARGGVVDVNNAGISWSRAQAALRAVGFAAWWRTPSQGPWGHHIHAVDRYDPTASPAAKRQVQSYYAGGSGLGRWAGGPVQPGRTYRVGERGTELLRMYTSGGGYVMPTPKPASLTAPTLGAGGRYGNRLHPDDLRALADMIMKGRPIEQKNTFPEQADPEAAADAAAKRLLAALDGGR